jgi:hypothetical protein
MAQAAQGAGESGVAGAADLHPLQVTLARLVQFVRGDTVAQHALQFLDGADAKMGEVLWIDDGRCDLPPRRCSPQREDVHT